MKQWPNTSSNKTCEVTFARIQVMLFIIYKAREIVTCDESARIGLLCSYPNSTIQLFTKKE